MFTAKEIWEAGRKALGLSEPSQEKHDAAPGTDPAPASEPADAPQTNSPNLYLDAPPPKAPEPRTAAPGPAATEDPVFDASAFQFEDRDYRIHFKNGCSGDYSGRALAIQFPFDPREVVDVRPVEEVGQE